MGFVSNALIFDFAFLGFRHPWIVAGDNFLL